MGSKEVIFKVTVQNTKEAAFAFQKMNEIADLVGIDEVEFEMRNKREGFLHILKRR